MRELVLYGQCTRATLRNERPILHWTPPVPGPGTVSATVVRSQLQGALFRDGAHRPLRECTVGSRDTGPANSCWRLLPLKRCGFYFRFYESGLRRKLRRNSGGRKLWPGRNGNFGSGLRFRLSRFAVARLLPNPSSVLASVPRVLPSAASTGCQAARSRSLAAGRPDRLR